MEDNINERLQNLLSNPENLKNIMSMVSSMSGTSTQEPKKSIENNEEKEAITELVAEATPSTIAENKRESRFSRHDDDRINLLRSLRPFLDDKKQHKVDGLIRALGTAKMINKYKDEDIFRQLGLK